MYNEQEKRVFIYPYLEILNRNQKEMRARCMELVECHAEHLPIDDSYYSGRELSDMGVEEKINALYELWDSGTNKDNAERETFSAAIAKDMHGRVMNKYQTYDYMDHDKYKRLEQLLDIMQETFGFGGEEEPDDEEDTGNEAGSDAPSRTPHHNTNKYHHEDLLPTRSDLGSQLRGTGKSAKKYGTRD